MRNNYKCEICEKRFQTNQKKNQHIRNVHGEVKTFICNVCNRIFGRKEQLTLHLKNYHQEGQRNYKCESCEKSFIQSGALKYHIKSFHEGQRNYKCDHCGKHFTLTGSL